VTVGPISKTVTSLNTMATQQQFRNLLGVWT